jgi:hypothetical protein
VPDLRDGSYARPGSSTPSATAIEWRTVWCSPPVLVRGQTWLVRFGLPGPMVGTSDDGASVHLGQPGHRSVQHAVSALVLEADLRLPAGRPDTAEAVLEQGARLRAPR